MTNDQSRFDALADAFLSGLAERVEDALDSVEVDLINGILTIETEDRRSFVINKHGPNRQIWLSSPISGAHHFDADLSPDSPGAGKRWIATRSGADLIAVLAADLSSATGETVTLD
jgi:frataxin